MKKPVQSRGPIVGIIMGSDSDWPVMEKAHAILNDFGVAHEVRVLSAHRTPQEMLDYAKTAEARGLKVLIAGAGGAAHLPGMLASVTTLPVLGVPVNITALDGIDAFLSIVQMPKGVPVATVAIDNSSNAALLAVRILSTGNDTLALRLQRSLARFKKSSVTKVKLADRKLKAKGRIKNQKR
jgi:5-(carboxyamino)imidazole ribonucleotide mutase